MSGVLYTEQVISVGVLVELGWSKNLVSGHVTFIRIASWTNMLWEVQNRTIKDFNELKIDITLLMGSQHLLTPTCVMLTPGYSKNLRSGAAGKRILVRALYHSS